jgi:hypothetical protein
MNTNQTIFNITEIATGDTILVQNAFGGTDWANEVVAVTAKTITVKEADGTTTTFRNRNGAWWNRNEYLILAA